MQDSQVPGVSHPSERRAVVADSAELASSVEKYLACPRCHASVTVCEHDIRCAQPGYGFTGEITGGIPVMRGQRDQSFFDDKHAVMEHGSA